MKRCSERIPEGMAIRDRVGCSAEEYGERMLKAVGGEYRRFARKASAMIPRGVLVLEIGPGPGWAGIELLKIRRDLRLLGLELSPDMIRAARENARREGVGDRASYLEGRAEDLSVLSGSADGRGSFGAIISRDSLHHWDDPAAAFRGFRELLGAGGTLYITDCRRDLSPLERVFVALIGRNLDQDSLEGWKNSIAAGYTAAELKALVRSQGLPECRVKGRFMDVEISRFGRD